MFPPIVTIEDFLRRPSRLLKPSKQSRYGQQTTRALNYAQILEVPAIDSGKLEEDGDNVIQLRSRRIIKRRDCETESESESTFSSPNLHLGDIQRLPKKKKKVKSLAERLFAAAVMSHGDPIDSLVQSNLDSSRRPLRFISDIEDLDTTPHVSTTKRRTWSLVDPRKAVPTRSPSFFRLNDRPMVNQRPLTSTLRLEHHAAPLKRDSSTRIKVQSSITRLPLSFVPIADAEASHEGRIIGQRYGLNPHIAAFLIFGLDCRNIRKP